jgi:rhamnogalacturonan endolyase
MHAGRQAVIITTSCQRHGVYGSAWPVSCRAAPTRCASLSRLLTSRIQVHVNGGGVLFSSTEFGGGNAIARHGIHGVQWDLEIPIRGYLLNRGQNVISITQPRAFSIFFGVMYDYVRLEGPSGS